VGKSLPYNTPAGEKRYKEIMAKRANKGKKGKGEGAAAGDGGAAGGAAGGAQSFAADNPQGDTVSPDGVTAVVETKAEGEVTV
jgi:hypothetical protein